MSAEEKVRASLKESGDPEAALDRPVIWTGYPLAAALTALTLLIRFTIGSRFEGPTMIVFTVPIILSAYWGGLGPGLLATVLSALGAAYFILPPVFSFYIQSPTHRWQEAILLLSGGVISFICEKLHRSQRRAEASLAAMGSAHEKLKAVLKDRGDLRAALDQHAIVAITDAQGKITFVNDKFCTISKYSREELIGQDHRIINSGYHSKGFIRHLWMTITHGQVWHGEIKNKAKDGTFYWVDTTIVPFLNADGKPRQYIAIRADITERKRAEEAAAHLAAIIQFSDDAIIGEDLNSIITSWNTGAEKLFGYPAREMVGTSIMRLIPNGRREEEDHIIGKIRRGDSLENFETRRQTSDGRLIDVSITASPIKDARGEIIGVSKMARDITERKQAQQTLQASEGRLRLVTDNARVGLVMVNAERRYTFVNATYAEILGLPSADIVGRRVADVLPDLYEDQIRNRLDFAFSGERLTYELRRPKPGGENYYTVRYEPTKIDGKVSHVVVVLTDITERKQAEAALEASVKEVLDFKSALDEHAIVAITDARGKITYVNDKFCSISKYSREELIGQDHRIINSGHHSKEFIRELWTTIGHGKVWQGEIKNKAKDGSFFWVATTIVPFLNANGRPRQYVAIRADITERKQAAEAVQESQALYHSLVDQISAGIFRKDAAGRYVFINSWLCKLKGIRPEAMLGKTPHEFAREELAGTGGDDSIKAMQNQLAAQGEDHHQIIMRTGKAVECEEVYPGPGGTSLFLHSVKSPVFDASGKVAGSQGVLFDITARKQAEEKVHQLNTELERRVIERTAELEAANKELEAFSYSVSHDLRAPLRAVNGFAGIILEDFGAQIPEEGRRHLERIRNGGQKMGMLIDDLLSFSRLGRQSMNRRAVDMARLVQDVLDELKAQQNNRPMELRVGELPACMADPALMKQVWVNLLSNAIKYTRDRKPAIVETGCAHENGETIYFVRDNGAGFDMQFVNKLFGVFQRLHRSDEFEGTGVGLAIVQRIVHRHGGRVWAEGKVDHGATFYFTMGENSNV